MTLTGQGATLTRPGAPTSRGDTSNCRMLIDPGFYGSCRVISAPSGSIAAIVEQQQLTNGGNQGGASPLQERDLVYRHVGSTWSLVLRRASTSTAGAESQLWQSDVNRDGDPKAVFVRPAPNEMYGEEIDVVEASGSVTLYRQLQGGFATIAPGGGLETFVPDSAGYLETVIRFSGGAWRIASVAQVSQSQAQANGEGPFTDPQGVNVG
ncbi:MAG TPA: hypothetical protein VG435_03930 [Acidimicrobiales bacterium]|nr:hypothetical protein [Acidimicrobiales bacterium]